MSGKYQFSLFATFLAVFLVGLVAEAADTDKPWIAAPGNAHWLKRHEQMLNLTKVEGKKVKVVFLGASWMDKWHDNGKEVWKAHYESRHCFNYGISGDKTQNVLWRVEHGEFDGLSPKLFIVMIGNNNVGNGHDTPADVAKGVDTVLQALHKKHPTSKLLILAALPRGGAINEKEKEMNELTRKFVDDKHIFYLDMKEHFLNGTKQIADLYVSDHLHLTPKGYEVWYKAMEPTFVKLSA